MKLLSIAVPCYNSQDYMRNCVDSLLEGGDLIPSAFSAYRKYIEEDF